MQGSLKRPAHGGTGWRGADASWLGGLAAMRAAVKRSGTGVAGKAAARMAAGLVRRRLSGSELECVLARELPGRR